MAMAGTQTIDIWCVFKESQDFNQAQSSSSSSLLPIVINQRCCTVTTIISSRLVVPLTGRVIWIQPSGIKGNFLVGDVCFLFTINRSQQWIDRKYAKAQRSKAGRRE